MTLAHFFILAIIAMFSGIILFAICVGIAIFIDDYRHKRAIREFVECFRQLDEQEKSGKGSL